MIIGIDGRLWGQTGVGRYIRNLTLNLLEIDKDNNYVLFVKREDRNEVESQISELKTQHLKPKIVEANIGWHSFSSQLKFPKIIEKEKVDLMHFPYFDVPILYKGAYVVTIHDLILHHFMSGEASTQPLWLYGFKMLGYKFAINTAARKAKKIIAVSKATKNEIIDHLRINPSKIEVIYESADDFNVVKAKDLPYSNYFLYVGNVYPHKNAEALIKAFKLLAKDKNVKLVFAGKEDFFYIRLKKKIGDLVKSGRVIFIHDADDQTLLSLYKNAICLVRPSHMEGFSLTPLEAISAGCLVIASDIPVHREVFGDGVLYFNLREFTDLADKMRYVLSLDKKSKEKLIDSGIKKSKEFSWSLAAKQTLSVYNNL